MGIRNNSKLDEVQRAWAKESYDRLIAKEAKVKTDGQTEGLSWFIRLTFTLTWVCLLACLLLNEVPLLLERFVSFAAYWVIVIELISVGVATLGLVIILIMRAALSDSPKELDEFASGLLTLDKPFSFGSWMAWVNNLMLIFLLALNGWTNAGAGLAILTFLCFCYVLVMRSIVINYYSGLSPVTIAHLREQLGGEEDA